MNDILSPKMLACIEHMRKHDNKLVRYPGGYWASVEWHMWHGPSFITPTVEALVRRGVATYTVWKDGRTGKFPIEVTLVDLDAPALVPAVDRQRSARDVV